MFSRGYLIKAVQFNYDIFCCCTGRGCSKPRAALPVWRARRGATTPCTWYYGQPGLDYYLAAWEASCTYRGCWW